MTHEYWSVDIPGLTYEQAVRIRDKFLAESTAGVVLLDPKKFMQRGFDPSTVQLLVMCLRAGLDTGELAYLDQAGALSMLEDFQEWLRQADEEE